MDLSKKRILMNAFFNSQYNYWPTIWMLHSHSLNSKFNRLHEQCLWIIYNDKQSSFEQLLNQDKSVSIHHRNIQVLAIEMYKMALFLKLSRKCLNFVKRAIIILDLLYSLQFRVLIQCIMVLRWPRGETFFYKSQLFSTNHNCLSVCLSVP